MRDIRLAALVGAIMALAIATSGASTDPARGAPAQAVTLRLLQTSTTKAAYDAVIANFERAYPNVRIDAQYLSTTQVEQLIVTQLQAGNAPDLFLTFPGRSRPSGIWTLANAGKLLDLTGESWNQRIPKRMKGVFSLKGKVYGWPSTVNPYGIAYNRALYTQLGLRPPTRFSQLLAMCRRIRSAGKVPIVVPFGDALVAGILLGRAVVEQLVYGAAPNWNPKRKKEEFMFVGPLWRRGLQQIVAMKNAGCFQPGAEGTSRAQGYAMLANGDAVMSVVAASELPNVWAINSSIPLRLIRFPTNDPTNLKTKNTLVTIGTSGVVSGSAATSHPTEVKAFISFLAREQQNSLFARLSGGIAPLDGKKGKLPAYMAALVPAFKADDVGLGGYAGLPIQVYAGYTERMVGLITGQTTVSAMLEDLDRRWNSSG